MKRSFLFAVIVIAVLISNLIYAQETLTILHLNDTHSTLDATGPRNADLSGTRGGIARAATVIGITKATEPNVITLHAGDFSIGDLFYNKFFGVPELQILKELGLDAMTLGNHEWDLTPVALTGALQGAFPDPNDAFPFLAANTDLSDPSLAILQDYISEYTIVETGGVKVGIFGLVTPATNLLSQPSPAIVSEDIINISVNMVTELTSQGCDVIILLSHLGFDLDKIVAVNIPGINLIVGGHDHYLLNEPLAVSNPGGTTWIVQANSNYQHIGKIKLLVDNGNVTLISGEVIPIDQSIPEEPTIKATIDYLKTEIEAFYGIPFFSQQAGFAASFFRDVETDLTSVGSHDTPLGNLVTDAFRSLTGTDIAIQACGSIGFALPEGPFVPSDIYRINGYGFNEVNTLGFRIVKYKLPGEALIAGLEFGLSEIEKNDENFLQCSGMEYTYDSKKNPGSRLTSVKINGAPINPSALYSVTSNEFLLLFLEYLQLPYSDFEYIPGDVTEFMALLEYIKNIGPVIYPKELGRITNLSSINKGEFFKAGGLFDSPEGSYISHPEFDGAVIFAINAQNSGKRKSNDFYVLFPELWKLFSATECDWLAVDDSYAQLKGKGKINDKGNYGFLVEAFEGEVNKSPHVIIRIWDKNTEELVYNNFSKVDFLGLIRLKKSFVQSKISTTEAIVTDYALEQNYPNPFNPSTNLKFSLKEGGQVTLKIYDIIGNEVATIVNENLPSGNYSYVWNAANLASGIYIYRLQTDRFTDMKKMILLK